MAKEFLRAECSECGNRQIVFSRASRKVDCMVCGEPIALPTGGKVELKAELDEELAVE
ncbi:MAG: 30S ribosomal protein S27e [Candidatus Nanohaloarchaea archaeon]